MTGPAGNYRAPTMTTNAELKTRALGELGRRPSLSVIELADLLEVDQERLGEVLAEMQDDGTAEQAWRLVPSVEDEALSP
jgi:hypothetical protein